MEASNSIDIILNQARGEYYNHNIDSSMELYQKVHDLIQQQQTIQNESETTCINENYKQYEEEYTFVLQKYNELHNQKNEESINDETKPGETKPEGTKPEETKHDETKTDETKPDETKPDETKSEETSKSIKENTIEHDTSSSKKNKNKKTFKMWMNNLKTNIKEFDEKHSVHEKIHNGLSKTGKALHKFDDKYKITEETKKTVKIVVTSTGAILLQFGKMFITLINMTTDLVKITIEHVSKKDTHSNTFDIKDNLNTNIIEKCEPIHEEPIHEEPIHEELIHEEPIHEELIHEELIHEEPIQQAIDQNTMNPLPEVPETQETAKVINV